MKVLAVLVCVVLTSMYFFPFVTVWLPAANTKMLLAALGLVWLISDLARSGAHGLIFKALPPLSCWALAISIISFLSVTFNNTSDFTYATYIVSMWVWVCGAYAVTRVIKLVHGRVDTHLICHYLIAVCVAQCLLAYTMGRVPALKDWVDGFLVGEGFMGKVDDRLYGIGAALDVAGMRFAAVLMIIAFLCVNSPDCTPRPALRKTAYILCFFIIAYVGNMVGRTTTLGALIGIGYWVVTALTGNAQQSGNAKRILAIAGAALLVLIPIIVYSYQTDSAVRDNIRFAFEGFFSLAEKGRWETNSNDILRTMYVLPDNPKTWLIGDGYFNNPLDSDPYYTGPAWRGFYHGTDVGYLRFIYYFGAAGAALFTAFMFCVARACAGGCGREYAVLFWGLLLLNCVVWLKVSSDLFPVFAIFLCSYEDNLSDVLPLQSGRNGAGAHQ